MLKTYTRILVGIDFSGGSERAMVHAARLAAGLRTRLDLAYLHPPMVSSVPELMFAPPDQTAVLADAERRLRELAARITYPIPVDVHTRLGEPVSGLLQLVAELAPDFVVVGSHGRSALMRVLLGSVADQLCRRSRVPVFVVPAAERVAALKAEVQPWQGAP
jgi:nucleotide-binding universal stress UspA family protein